MTKPGLSMLSLNLGEARAASAGANGGTVATSASGNGHAPAPPGSAGPAPGPQPGPSPDRKPEGGATGEEDLPYREIGGWPSTRGFGLSVLLHFATIFGLANFHFTLPPPAPPQEAALSPTEIRLNGKLYYVNSISGSEGAKKSDKVVAPLAAAAGKSARPRPNGGRAGRASPQASLLPAMPAPAPARVAEPAPPAPEAPKAEPAPRANQRALARTFVPPEVKRSPNATQTLIQPISPPDLTPPPTPLPSFRVMTPALPKLPKPFVAPGRKVPQPPAQVAQLQPLQLDLIHADPVPSSVQPKLAMPRTPPPPDPPKKAPEGPTPAPAGEPINILSLSNRPVPPSDKVIVPQGNIAQESGESAASSDGAGKNSAAAGGAGTAAAASGTGRNPSGSGPSANGQDSGTRVAEAHLPGAGGAGDAAAGAGTGAAPGNGLGIGAAGPGAGAGSPGAGSSGEGTSGAGTGHSTVGNGTGAALTGGGASGSTTAIVGGPGGSPNGTGTGTGTGAGAGAGSGRALPGQMITRPPGGNFDTVVVQTSPLDQYPESRGLLSGRPIYSVYVSVGSGRDWTLYFCVPNEKPAANDSPVVQLGPPATPVKAPYPFKMMRPAVTLPSWEKYVLVHGYVNAEGHFESLRIVRSILPDVDKSLLASLSNWEFRAATRDGVPIMVEFLLSIPAKGL